MIFVTVGTHEQQFDRLIQFVDDMKRDGEIEDEVIIQTGYSTYEPKYCTWQKMFPYSQMKENIAKARIVITHGGPSSFIMPLEIGKTPIVVPRQKKYDEHVNDHQLEFCSAVEQRDGTILVAEEMEQLRDMILNYESVAAAVNQGKQSNNARFNEQFELIVADLFKK